MNNNHVILNHLDTPSRILLWPMNECLAVVSPLLLLLILGLPFSGIFLSLSVAYGIRFFKRHVGQGYLEGFLYWFYKSKKFLKITPPSSVREYIRLFQVNSERLSRAKPGAIIMHPGPMNEGVEINHDAAYVHRSLIEQQVTNGVAIRMALLYLIAGGKTR